MLPEERDAPLWLSVRVLLMGTLLIQKWKVLPLASTVMVFVLLCVFKITGVWP